MTFLMILGTIIGIALIVFGFFSVVAKKNYAIGILVCALGIIFVLGMMLLAENRSKGKNPDPSEEPAITSTQVPNATEAPKTTENADPTESNTKSPEETTPVITSKPTAQPTSVPSGTASVITPLPAGDYTEVHYDASTIVKPNNWNGRTIYLTFDDGPSTTTQKVLDNLAKYNVKCTFFVIGQQVSSYKSSVMRALEEGHTVAVHCYEHEYDVIYASKEAYFNDFNKAVDTIRKELNYNPLIFRFPGGTSNTTSKQYCPGIMTYLSKEMPKRGYTYCDWNVCPDDAMKKQSADVLFDKMKKDINAGTKDCYVLLHDYGGMENTADAALKLIEWGLDNGFAFDRLTPETKMYQHNPGN